MAEVDLVAAVAEATEWALVAKSGRAQALAQLARTLAKDIATPPVTDGKSAPPTAALAKELRATLEDLEGLRDGDDAQGQLVSGLSTPVLN